MEINIGTNVKRLRTEKGVTQEQLAEAMNVTCAAVSKWEREETYPDITLLQPLAYYFGVSLDELVGYDKDKVDQQIEDLLAEFWRISRQDWKAAQKLIEDAYRTYPNDYRVMFRYMGTLGVDDAEPDLELALAKKDELTKICDKIIGGCTDGYLRLGAWKMKAVLLHAEGKTEEALRIHSEKCGNWYNTCGQMNEQMFQKDRPEFLYWAKHNMYELVDFGADKLVKSYFFDPAVPYDELLEKTEGTADELFRLGCERGEAYLVIQAESIYGRLLNDLKYRPARGAKNADMIRILDKSLSAAQKIDELAALDKPLFDVALGERDRDSILAVRLGWAQTSTWDRDVELRKDPEYLKVIEKYKKK